LIDYWRREPKEVQAEEAKVKAKVDEDPKDRAHLENHQNHLENRLANHDHLANLAYPLDQSLK